MALLQYFGQCGPLLGTRLYPESDGPLYLKGMAVCAVFMGVVALLALGLRVVLVRENRKKGEAGGVWVELGQEDDGDVERLELDERGALERRREAFVFML